MSTPREIPRGRCITRDLTCRLLAGSPMMADRLRYYVIVTILDIHTLMVDEVLLSSLG